MPPATDHHWPALSLQHIDWGFVIKSQHYGTAVFTIAYLIILACVHWLADSRSTPIFLYDASISYPYKSDTIPAVAAVLVPFALLIISMLAYEFFVYRKVGSLDLCKLRVAQPVWGASRHQGHAWRRMGRHQRCNCCFSIPYICTGLLSAGWPWCKGSCVLPAYDTCTIRWLSTARSAMRSPGCCRKATALSELPPRPLWQLVESPTQMVIHLARLSLLSSGSCLLPVAGELPHHKCHGHLLPLPSGCHLCFRVRHHGHRDH